MSGDVTIRLAGDRRVVDVTYDVEDAPPIQRRYARTIRFQPDRLSVTFVDGELSYFTVGGPRILKDRLGGLESQTYHSYNLDDDDNDAPGWALPYVRSLPRRPRPTVLLTNDDLARILAGSEMGCSGYTEEEPPPAAREPAEFTVRLYTPEELLEAARRARKAVADATGNPDAGQEMPIEQAVTLTRRFDLWKLLEGRK